MDDEKPSEDALRSDAYAFHNHSSETVQNRQPPSIDDKQQARQKRKRTSQEDQVVLEASYQSDPKPDKAARLELTKKVALSEKEVQIWFQNRRQSSRRKSRPLLPHEVVQYQMSRAGIPPDSLTSRFGSAEADQGRDNNIGEDSSQAPDSRIASDLSHEPNPVKTENSLPRSISGNASTLSCNSASEETSTAKVPQPDSRPLLSSLTSMPSTHPPEQAPQIGYLANRRSAPPARDYSPNTIWPSIASVVSFDRKLKKSASFVRLSMNAEGKAEIVTKDASSPSPPRPHNTYMLPQPSAALSDVPVVDFSRSSGLHRSSSGRSRDSRAWEFWCDKESRSELGTAAEKDATGSATGAIGLLRTASGRNVLGSVASKRNSAAGQPAHPAKRSKLDHKRAPLQRSSTSQGRLQGKTGHAVPKLKHSESASLVRVHGNDSDKENWSPSSDGASDNFGRESTASTRPPQDGQMPDNKSSRRALAETGNSRGRVSKSRKPVGGGDKSSASDPENDVELAAFMRGGKQNASAGDDMDCVQGLLSLSQGNWR